MTREEAINKWIIPAIRNTWNDKKCEEILKALKQEPCDHYTEGYFKGYDDGQKGKLEQEPCDDAITRILKRMWNCRGKHTTSIDKVKMEQIIRDELPSVNLKADVLDKIRAEIAKRTIEQGFDADEWSISYDELIKIIDKYKDRK